MLYLLPHLIDRAAEREPQREAVRFGERALSYARLAGRRDALARVLHDQGVRRGDRVGIYLPKSLETAVALQGIMRAGAAFVPLDPSAPPARTARVIADCGIGHLVTVPAQRDAVERVRADAPSLTCVVGIDAPEVPGLRGIGWGDVEAMDAGPVPETGLIEQDLAYVMYTSGSTGKPKGIMHTHHSGLSYANWAADVYGLRTEDRLANHAPLHFDISTFDFFAGPRAAATTVIVPEETMKMAASYSSLLAAERISVLFTVPFALVQLLLRGVLARRDLGALRWLIFGGEPFPTKHLRELMRQLPHVRFSNMYGPAEVNGCTYHHVPQLPEGADAPIPIGVVAPNVEALVVDADDAPAAPGAVGELLIRSPTMMRGYWGRPDLNAAAFSRRTVRAGVEDVFYRTGDLVQLPADGLFHFLGRKDRQVKTRGYRVELDEVEASLVAHADVEEAAVFAVADGAGSQRIAAAVIARPGTAPTPADLARHASRRLPWYAVPARIDLCEAFPRTTSGKIDRRRLQDLAEQG